MSISVIIPTLNEESCLEPTLKSIGQGVEIIIVDGGSNDSTVRIANKFTDKIVVSEKGRGIQMDMGAREASASSALGGGSDIFLFLHADTRLPDGWREKVAEMLKDAKVVGGCFRLRIDSKKFSFRIIETMVNLRSRYLGLVYGDQAIFVRRNVFTAAGGFMGLPLMEDVDLIRRLKKHGKVVLLGRKVVTSPRRWERKGILRTTARNWLFLSLYYLGVSPERLYKKYYA